MSQNNPRNLSIGVLRQRVGRYTNTLVADGPTATTKPEDYLIFEYQQPEESEWLLITQEEFDADNAPPGKYRVQFYHDTDPVTQEHRFTEQTAEIKIERLDRESPGKLRDMERCAAGLVHTANSESSRAHARLESEEKRHDATKEKLRLKEDRVAELQAMCIGLQAQLEAADDTEESAFGEIVVALLAKWLGMDGAQVNAERAQAIEIIVRTARTNIAVQRALIKAGAGDAVKLLQQGDEPPPAPPRQS